MRVKYFSDTDTAHLEFLDNDVYETRETSENIYVDLGGCPRIELFEKRPLYIVV